MNIDEILKEKGLSKAEVAKKAGILPQNFNRIIANPKEETIRKIASALGVPVSRLFSDGLQDEEVQAPVSSPVSLSGSGSCPYCGRALAVEVTLSPGGSSERKE